MEWLITMVGLQIYYFFLKNMRPIKFCAYIKSLWIIVDVQRINFDIQTIECYLISQEEGDMSEYSFSEIELIQFTWLLDKNGNEIYEGDIIQYTAHPWYLLPYSIWEVMWADVGYSISDRQWRNPDIDFWEHDELEVDLLDHCEVIGNIYENPNY